MAHTSSNRNRGVVVPVIGTAAPASDGQRYIEFSGTHDGEIHAASEIRSHIGGQLSGSAGAATADTRATTSPPAISIAATTTSMSDQVPPERTIVDMQLTHFGHSCLLADFGNTTVLFDPGNFSHGFEGMTGLSAIVITHQHPDHADLGRLPALCEANPDAALYADPQTAAQLGTPCQTSQEL